jgi:putative salt-induced outer membrane protein YdiY
MLGELMLDTKKIKGIVLTDKYNVKMGEGGMIIRNNCGLAYSSGKGQWLHCQEGSSLITNFAEIATVSKNAIAAPKFAHKGAVDAAYNSSSGNTDSNAIHIGASAELKHDLLRHRGSVSMYREKLNGVTSKDEEMLKYSLDYFMSPEWFATANASYESNEIKDLDNRMTLGFGVGHQFFDEEDTALSGNLGIAFVSEENIVAPDKDYTALRWSTDYRVNTGFYGAELVHTNVFLIPSNDLGEWIMETDTGLRAPIWGGVNGLFMFEFDYDNEPAAGKAKSDSKLSIGLNYSW